MSSKRRLRRTRVEMGFFDKRPYLRSLAQFVAVLAASALSAFAARYGINVPPVPLPVLIEVAPPAIPPTPVVPPVVVPKKPVEVAPAPRVEANPKEAVGKLRTARGGCSFTVIGPPSVDGSYLFLSAAHCMTSSGESVKLEVAGRSFHGRVVALDREADCSWVVGTEKVGELPFAVLARENPGSGVAIWHAGFGVHRPGNVESGSIVFASPTEAGQLRMRLAVSSGDSGGGIFRTDSGELVSCVCCTVRSVRGMWTQGAATERIRALMPNRLTGEGPVDSVPLPSRDELVASDVD